jgi:penicillin-binding protein 1A
MANTDRPGGGAGRGGPKGPPKGANGGGAPARRSVPNAVFYWAAVVAVWVVIAAIGVVVFFAQGLPDTSKLYEIHHQPSISYLDRNGALLAVRGSQYAPPINLDTLPAYVPGAFVSVEDRRF